MACYYSLYKLIDATNTTGDWYATTAITGLKHADGSTPDDNPLPPYTPTSYSAGNLITSNPYLWIDPSGLPVGIHKVEYRVTSGSATDTTIFTITVNPAINTGTAPTGIQWCNCNGAPKNLLALLGDGVDTDGVWSGSGTLGSAYSNGGTPLDPTDDTFTPSGTSLGVATSKTYSFTYTINRTGDCTECNKSTTFNVEVLGGACDGMWHEAAYYLDNPGERVSEEAIASWYITSAKYNGVQLAPTPIQLAPTGTWTNIEQCSCFCPLPGAMGDVNYVMDVVDALNDLNFPDSLFIKVCGTPLTPCYAPSTGGWFYSFMVNKYIYLSWPSCATFEIIFEWAGGKTRWTESSNERWNGTAWVLNLDYDQTHCGVTDPIVNYILTDVQVTN